MTASASAQGRWTQLDGRRTSLITRCEKYAGYTIAKLCTPTGYDQQSQELQHGFQAVGAQAVNHLANKIMLALFAPSRPFFRLDPTEELRSQIQSVGMDEAELTKMLTEGEKAAIRRLDSMGLRPKLYEAIKHLIVTGNCLLHWMDDGVRVRGIKEYVVRRSMSGKVMECMTLDKVMFDELDQEVQAFAAKVLGQTRDREQEVSLYTWIKRLPTGDYSVEQWVNQYQLPQKFNGKYPEDQLPYSILTWDLSDDAHYGTGLVEDYAGDFAGLTMMSKAQITGAILASEFRWLVNPGGMTKVEDLEESENGSAIPGVDGDVSIVQSNKSGDLQYVSAVGGEYIQRIGRGFLLGTAVTRDAERVTAEEIRMQANELETSLGGAYSRLAIDFQMPMAYWLLRLIGFKVANRFVRPSIVTGMEALSRTGDLDDFKMLLGDLAAVAALPPLLLGELNMRKVFAMLATPRRINPEAFLKSEAEKQAEMQAAQEQQMQLEANSTGIQAAGKIAENQAKGNA